METVRVPALATLQTCLHDLFVSEPVELAYLFGSAATDRMTPFSDVDIALVVDSDVVPPAKRLKYELKIEDLVAEKCDLGRADVRVINEAPLVIKGKVVTEGILLYARDESRRIDFETTTRARYFDFLPFAQSLRSAFFDNIRDRGLHG